MAASSGGSKCRKVKRILIAGYGNVLVPDLIKIFDEKEYSLFVMFNELMEIRAIQKALGKKRIVPILIDWDKSKDISEELIKYLPIMDSIINFRNSSTISKHYEKRKRYIPIELKFQKATASHIKNVLDLARGPCVLNLIPETNVGVTHMFDPDGIDIPISTHISTSLRTSFRKIFSPKKSVPRPHKSRNEPGPSSVSNPNVSVLGMSRAPDGDKGSSNLKGNASRKIRRSFSLLRRKESSAGQNGSQQLLNTAETIRNELWTKESTSFRKSLNKLHEESSQQLNKAIKKLDSSKSKKQRKVEKEIEEEMKQEKAKLDSKSNEQNSATLSRSSALTAETANRIIASREARVNKEVCRTANRKKVVEFEKIDEAHKEKVAELRSKHTQQLLKRQLCLLEETRKKYEKRVAEANQKAG